MKPAADDLSGVLATLDRLEAQRRLKSIPAVILETSWVLDAHIEAVIDAVLVAVTAGDDRAFAHARHTGEWASRIAAELPQAPSPPFMRRCGVLAQADPAVLSRIRELREYAVAIHEFQHGIDSTAARILTVAAAFDSLIFAADPEQRYAPSDALRMLLQSAHPGAREIVAALRRACRNAPEHLFSAA
jgi:HD-GYP domain-containing protein (c-di-GMP phosphodiesterase class II)